MRRQDVLVLAYHDIVPNGASALGDHSLHLAQARFAAQLDRLQRTHDVVPLTELSSATTGRRPRAVITFDDAYRGALTAGLHELTARDLPATMFVAPAFLGDHDFWWDALAGEHGVKSDAREHALHSLKGRDAEIRAWWLASGRSLHTVPEHARCVSEAELHSAMRYPRLTIGSHSWSHANLAALAQDELEHELTAPLPWLRERFERVVPWIAYPYGLSSAGVARRAREAGYEGALLVDGGWIREGASPPHSLPRINIPAGVSDDGFELRISGLLS